MPWFEEEKFDLDQAVHQQVPLGCAKCSGAVPCTGTILTLCSGRQRREDKSDAMLEAITLDW